MTASGTTRMLNLNQFPDHDESSAFYKSPYQHHHSSPFLNLGMSSVGPSNLCNSCITSSSFTRVPNVPVSNGFVDQIPFSSDNTVMGVYMDESGRNHQFMDNVRGSYKRKNAEVVLDNYSHGSIPNPTSFSFSLSQNAGRHNWDKSFETGVYTTGGTSLTAPENRGEPLPLTDGSQRNVRSRTNISNLQMGPPVLHHHHHNLLQGVCNIPSFQPAGSAWMEQFGNIAGDGGSSAWDYSHAISYMQGIPVEIGNMGGQGHLESSLSRNSGFFLHPASLHSQHQRFPCVQGMYGQGYSYHPQLPSTSYRHPPNNFLHQDTMNPLRHSTSRNSRTLPSGAAEWSYRPQQWSPQSVQEGSHGCMRILLQESVALQESLGFYGVDNSFDQHRDMRLDIDSLSYEELLALEEQIGDVNTGLSEDSILKNLKTRIYSSSASAMSKQLSSIVPEVPTCIICQMEYEEEDRLGTLECGHDYHAYCIKQWLLVKNICPICKTPALASARTG